MTLLEDVNKLRGATSAIAHAFLQIQVAFIRYSAMETSPELSDAISRLAKRWEAFTQLFNRCIRKAIQVAQSTEISAQRYGFINHQVFDISIPFGRRKALIALTIEYAHRDIELWWAITEAFFNDISTNFIPAFGKQWKSIVNTYYINETGAREMGREIDYHLGVLEEISANSQKMVDMHNAIRTVLIGMEEEMEHAIKADCSLLFVSRLKLLKGINDLLGRTMEQYIAVIGSSS